MRWGGLTEGSRWLADLNRQRKILTQARSSSGFVSYNGGCERGDQIEYFLLVTLLVYRRYGMAAKDRNLKAWIGFVNVTLTKEQDDAFDVWDCHDDDLWTLLQEATTSGHKFTLSWNGTNSTFNAALTGGEGSGDNKGYTLSSFSNDWYEAVRLLLFKHFIVCEGKWSEVSPENSRRRG